MKNVIKNAIGVLISGSTTCLPLWRHMALCLSLIVILPMAMANAGQVGDKNFTLSCKFTKYGNSGAATKLTRGWIPPNQRHRITGDEVIFDSYHKKLKGTVTKRNDERIEWTYQERAEDRKGRRFGVIRYYSYFFTTKKIASKMGFKIYRDFEYVWGTCTSRQNKNAAVSKKNKSAKSLKKARSSSTAKPAKKWTYLRGNGDISIYHHAKLDIFMVTSVNPWFDKLYDRLVKMPKTQIGVAMHWKDDDRSIGDNNYVYRHPDSVSTTMHGKKRAIILRGKFLDQLKNEQEQFLEFAISDLETDIIFAEQTTTEYR